MQALWAMGEEVLLQEPQFVCVGRSSVAIASIEASPLPS